MSRKLKQPPPASEKLAPSLTDDNAELGHSHRDPWPKIAADGSVVGALCCNPYKDPQQAHLLDTATPVHALESIVEKLEPVFEPVARKRAR